MCMVYVERKKWRMKICVVAVPCYSMPIEIKEASVRSTTQNGLIISWQWLPTRCQRLLMMINACPATCFIVLENNPRITRNAWLPS